VKDDAIIDRNPEQKRMWIDEARIALDGLGFSVVRTEWLRSALDDETKGKKISETEK